MLNGYHDGFSYESDHIMSGRNIETLEKLMNENPDMKDIYSEKLQKAKQFNPKVMFAQENIQKAKEQAKEAFREAEQQLSKTDSGKISRYIIY